MRSMEPSADDQSRESNAEQIHSLSKPVLVGNRPAFLKLANPNSGSNTDPLVGLAGLEPATSALSGQRSNRLSYRPKDRYFIKVWWHPSNFPVGVLHDP